jgi:hypothetical protein
MKHPKFPDLTNHLDAAETLASEIINSNADDRTPHDLEDLHMARLCIESACALVQSADSGNRVGIAERMKR